MSSSEQSSVNPETIEQTKQQIRGLVSEIAQLSKSDLEPEQYYSAFLQRIVSALAAVGGAVWVIGESRRPELTYQINLSDTLLDSGSEDAGKHLHLLDHVVRSGEPQLIPPLAGTGDERSGANPTRYLLVLAPLVTDGKVEGVVEIFQRPNSQPATQRGYLRFLLQMCELCSEWLKSRKLRQFSDRHSLWAQADEFARLVHESLDTRETAFTIVNEARRMIGCDRVSIAIKRGMACKIEAVSGQDTLENRSNIVAALGRLATRVVATGEPLWYEGSTDDLPPQVEESLEAYVDESYAKTVTVLPLRKPDRADVEARGRTVEADRENVAREVIGALIVEQIETDLPREILHPRVDLVYEHSARALSNSIDHNSVFLMPVWRTIGKSPVLVNARNLPKTLLATIVVLLVLIGLFIVRKDFNMEARGNLQPVERRDVFFGIDGVVEQVLVKDGDQVTAGQELVVMSNPDLEQRYKRVLGDISENSERLGSLYEELTRGQLSRSDEAQVSAQIKQLVKRLETLNTEKDLIETEMKRLTVVSPMAGMVMLPWNAKQSLLHRPVSAQQTVMTIADPSGQWELELAMPERRIGHVRRAQTEMKPDLDVSYILATDPGNERTGTVKYISTVTQVSGQDGPTVKLLIDIDKASLVDPRPGATVIADVKCGRSSVAYAWFHEALEWVQKNVLF